jgi:hypothetical protein
MDGNGFAGLGDSNVGGRYGRHTFAAPCNTAWNKGCFPEPTNNWREDDVEACSKSQELEYQVHSNELTMEFYFKAVNGWCALGDKVFSAFARTKFLIAAVVSPTSNTNIVLSFDVCHDSARLELISCLFNCAS